MDKITCLDFVRKVYSINNFVKFCDIKFDDMECGQATLSMVIDPEKHTNLYGIVHGGALESLADTAIGAVCATVGARVMTLSITTNFIKNIHPGEKATCIAKIRHHGRTTIIVDADMFNQQNQLMCRTLATMFVRGSFPEVPAKW